MSCKKIEEKLLDDGRAFLDLEVREHLSNCPACSRLYDELEEIGELNRALARREKAPQDFTGRVIERIPTGFRRQLPLLSVGVILAVVAGIAAVGSYSDPPSTDVLAGQTSPVSTPPTYPLLLPSQPVELDRSYPRVQLYMIAPPATQMFEKNFLLEIEPADQAQTDYLRYVSH